MRSETEGWIDAPKEHFLATYRSARKIIAESRPISAAHSTLGRAAVKTLLMYIHTIKGECRSIKLHRVVKKAHELEEFCQQAKCDPLRYPLNRKQVRSGLDHLEQLLEQYYTVAHEYLGWTEAENHLQIEKAELVNILDQTPEHVLTQKDSSRLASYLKGLIFVSLKAFINDLEPIAQRLARDLDKAPPCFERSIPKVYLRESGKILLQRTFTHLLRNAMDHGIEAPAIRVARSKALEGCVRVDARHEGDELIIRFSDAGQGQDLTAIRSRAKL